MATKTSQRVGILIITVVMVVGTIGSFAVMILANQNASKESAAQAKQQEEMQKAFKEYQDKVDEQNKKLSAQYYDEFKSYESRVGKFDRDAVGKEVQTEDLKVGDGAEVTDKTEYAAYYIGWLPSGKVFDGSIDGGTLEAPLTMPAQLIEGWTEGVRGMKVGGVREITIPSDKAYKDQAQKDQQGNETIPPNSPLKFIVMAIPKPEQVELPASLGALGQ